MNSEIYSIVSNFTSYKQTQTLYNIISLDLWKDILSEVPI